jgi:hypothetical protein
MFRVWDTFSRVIVIYLFMKESRDSIFRSAFPLNSGRVPCVACELSLRSLCTYKLPFITLYPGTEMGRLPIFIGNVPWIMHYPPFRRWDECHAFAKMGPKGSHGCLGTQIIHVYEYEFTPLPPLGRGGVWIHPEVFPEPLLLVLVVELK